MGVWLWSYGEAIYDTRPFVVSGETVATGERVHYTRKGNYLYVIMLDWPGTDKPLFLKSLNSKNLEGKRITDATLLSLKKDYKCITFQTEQGTTLTLPKGSRRPSDSAHVVRLTIE